MLRRAFFDATVWGLVAGLPAFAANLEKAAAMLAEGGVRLHPETLAALRGERTNWWPWAVAALLAVLFLV